MSAHIGVRFPLPNPLLLFTVFALVNSAHAFVYTSGRAQK